MSTSVPLPGQHLPDRDPEVDPPRIVSRVEELLSALDESSESGAVAGGPDALSRQAQILEQAHDILVESLAAVDKI
ncbi:hypothetical protein ERC79_00985 [Rhodococcus sp. ABRD24]|uniref:hypothetical protein n=1 Tax=Rhodococcus sp. ABRD24 TaxID=2507582 RepID=UPI001040194C|nr:hypothetical protein [Rhodococcus sp. ABRD24]QBJ94698.1 hypothetical protein ERC79_00985 [Rhodococcus sp. ABRD24]